MTARLDYRWTGDRPPELCQLIGTWKGSAPWGSLSLVEPKIDGWRAIWARGSLWTRGGQPIRGAGHIEHRCRLIERAAGCPLAIDGEFQVGGCLSATKRHCESGWRGGDAGTLHAFDVLPLDAWERGEWSEPLYERKAWLADLIRGADAVPEAWEWRERTHGLEPDEPAIEFVDELWRFSDADIEAEARAVWAAGGEGVVIKDPNAPYQRRRVGHALKHKAPGYVAR